MSGNGTGPSRGPRVCMLKKFQYTEARFLNQATSTYQYLSEYLKPDITKCTGAQVQFAAYELWRIKNIKVYIQNASQTQTFSNQSNISDVSNTTIWSAADYGFNENISGETIMQYQNAKKNTLSLNKWTKIVDTPSRINGKLTGAGKDFILPASMWVNTTNFSSDFYSGYQLFIQNFGSVGIVPELQPAVTIITELIVEFMQPAFQNNASAFSQRAFGMRLVTQPDSSDPSIKRAYVFNYYRVMKNADGDRVFEIHLVREDGESGSLTFNNTELLEAIHNGTSGKYFNARPATYDGPYPPAVIPSIDYSFGNNIVNN